ncbi:unnamed protein product [Mortierella alpina]
MLERIWAGRPQDSDIPNKQPIHDLLDKGEVKCGGGEVHHDLQKEALSDLDYDGEPDEEEVRAGASATSENKNIVTLTEASGKRIKSLAALVRRVLESPEVPRAIKESDVLDLAFSGTNLTKQELAAIVHIANALTPYVPEKWRNDKGRLVRCMGHAALKAPLVLIANATLKALGHDDYCRSIAPQQSLGALRSFRISPMSIMEVLCRSEPGFFDFQCGLTDRPINSHFKIAACEDNTRRLIGAFFNIPHIEAVCSSHKISFCNRMTFVDEETIQLHGYSIKGDGGRDLTKKKGKTDKNESTVTKWETAAMELGCTHQQAKIEAEKCSQELETLQDDIDERQNIYNNLHRNQVLAKRQLQNTIRAHSNHAAIATLRAVFHQARAAANEAMIKLIPLQRKKQELRDKRYEWNKVAEASSSGAAPSAAQSSIAAPRTVKPTWESAGALAPTPAIDMTAIREGLAVDPARKIAITGGDPGLVVQLTTISTTLDQLLAHANYYQSLADLSAPQEPQEQPQELPQEQPPEPPPPIPKAKKLRTQRLNFIAHSNKLTAIRNRQLRRNSEVGQAYDRVRAKTASLESATSLAALLSAHNSRKRDRCTIRSFENSRSRIRARHTLRLRNPRAVQRVAIELKERALQEYSGEIYMARVLLVSHQNYPHPAIDPSDGFCSLCQKHHTHNHDVGERFEHSQECTASPRRVQVVNFMGNAGTCVGSRLKGHPKRGGMKISRELAKSTVTAMQDEFRTSKTCLRCSNELKHPSARRVLDKVVRTVKVNGSVICLNPVCPAVRAGQAIMSRDGNAATAIAFVGVCTSLSDPPMAPRPFMRSAIPLITDASSPKTGSIQPQAVTGATHPGTRRHA